MKFFLFFAIFLSSVTAFSQEKCEAPKAEVSADAETLANQLAKICNGLFKKVVDLEIKHGEEGSFSVLFQDGKPSLLKMDYGQKTKVVSFSDLALGKPLIYEDDKIKGKAIILEKADPFLQNGRYQFKLRLRTQLVPETHMSHIVTFEGTPQHQTVMSQDKKVSKIVISPGIKMFSWTGIFTKAEFK